MNSETPKFENPTAAEDPGKSWFIWDGQERAGPYSVSDLEAMVSNRKVDASSMVWQAGMEGWRAMGEVDALRGLISRTDSANAAEGDDSNGKGLTLRQSRRFDQINPESESEAEEIDVQSMLKDGAGMVKDPPAARKRPGLLESFGLRTFEAIFAAGSLLVLGAAAFAAPFHWTTSIIVCGLIWVAVALVVLVIRAFMRHWAWGLGCLFVPFALIAYVIVDRKKALGGAVLLGAGVLMAGGTLLLPQYEQSELADSVTPISLGPIADVNLAFGGSGYTESEPSALSHEWRLADGSGIKGKLTEWREDNAGMPILTFSFGNNITKTIAYDKLSEESQLFFQDYGEEVIALNKAPREESEEG